ncbi:nitroreductase family protein [Mucilaginibacter boryungensis]|uniref:Nitroreductase n=1 Tax=Mucilaginibacter boryungensis TaxID=768480 RepID=A0ABR9XGQ0_9SPHI|nr:nitroreductase [Mucilaginibacter boryungensis]MBE9666249.1 nitroreductase [Mucilaginibacter boryungensis]
MDNNNFSIVSNTIKNRRSIKPAMMNGNKIPNGHVAALLELADWAPNHGNTQPWQFIVYADPAKFCQQHADLYQKNTAAEAFNPTTFNNLTHMGDNVSHIVIAVMKRGDLPKIPPFEEIAAASAAVQNLLIGATALNIASFWSTGGMTLRPEFKEFLNLGDDDNVLGILYLGYANEHPEGKRKVPVEEKVKWMD